MENLKKVSLLQWGDKIKGIRGDTLEVISYINGELCYYNETSREFKTAKIEKSDYVFLKK